MPLGKGALDGVSQHRVWDRMVGGRNGGRMGAFWVEGGNIRPRRGRSGIGHGNMCQILTPRPSSHIWAAQIFTSKIAGVDPDSTIRAAWSNGKNLNPYLKVTSSLNSGHFVLPSIPSVAPQGFWILKCTSGSKDNPLQYWCSCANGTWSGREIMEASSK